MNTMVLNKEANCTAEELSISFIGEQTYNDRDHRHLYIRTSRLSKDEKKLTRKLGRQTPRDIVLLR